MSLDDYVKTKDGYNLKFRFHDNGKPAIVLVHGLCMDQDSWYHQFNFLKHHYSILSYDLRGHGKSDKPNKTKCYTLDKFVEDVDCVADYIGLDRFVLMGFSLGGSIALEYAQKIPYKPRKLVTINAPYSLKSIKKSFFGKYAIARNVPKMIMGIGLDDKPIWEYQGKLDTHRKTFVQAELKVIDKIMTAMIIQRPTFKKLDIDHLLIYSSNDEIVKAKAPEGSNHTIIEGGHHYVIAQKPNEVNYVIRKFIDS
jgi:pimeloyl-ACP methyl ester carboxylesterase